MRDWTYRTGPNLPKRSNSSSGVTLKLFKGVRRWWLAMGEEHTDLRFFTNRALHSKGGLAEVV